MSDDDADIYENLPNFFLDETYKNLKEEKNELEIKVEELGKQLDEIKKENENLAAKVKALGKNISCLYKTAIRELERKDQIIAELRKERDNLLFRRGMHSPSIPETKRSNRKQLTPTKKVRDGNIKRPDNKMKTNAVKPEVLSSITKAIEVVELDPPEENNPEKNTQAVEAAGVKEVYPKSERKPEENLRAECNSTEETISENSLSEKTAANVSNIQILSGSEDSFVQTPTSDKFTSHSITEDCGFGRRRKVRRIIRAASSSAGSTPIRSELDVEVPPEDQPIPAKRICVEGDLSSVTVDTSADKSTSCKEVDARNNSNAMEESSCEKIGQDTSFTSGNCISKDLSVSQNNSDCVLPNQEKTGEEVKTGKQPEHEESVPRKEGEHRSCSVVLESCEVDLKVSSTDDQSTNSGNLSIRSQSDCSSLPPTNHTTVEVKARTTTYVEEYSVSSIEFDNNRSGGSSTPKSDRISYPEGDVSPNERRGKRPRSWEKERVHLDSPAQNQDDGRRMRHSPRDSYRERDRRDSYYGRDYRSSRVSSSGGDRMRRMERDPRGDRNYRSRIRDHDDDRCRGPDSMRNRGDDRRDSSRYGRTRSRERRSSDSFHRSSSKNRDSERGSGHHSRDRNRREMEEQDKNGCKSNSKADIHSKSDKSPRPTSLQNDEHLRSNCIPPTEWD